MFFYSLIYALGCIGKFQMKLIKVSFCVNSPVIVNYTYMIVISHKSKKEVLLWDFGVNYLVAWAVFYHFLVFYLCLA